MMPLSSVAKTRHADAHRMKIGRHHSSLIHEALYALAQKSTTCRSSDVWARDGSSIRKQTIIRGGPITLGVYNHINSTFFYTVARRERPSVSTHFEIRNYEFRNNR